MTTASLTTAERYILAKGNDFVEFAPTTAACLPSVAVSFKPGISKRARKVTRVLSVEAARNEWRRLVRLGYRRW